MTIFDESKNLNMFNFTMGTILGKDFAQAQVHTKFIAQVPKTFLN